MNFTTDPAPRTPTVGLPPGALLAMHRALAQHRSPEESAALMREVGFEAGAAFYDSFTGWLGDRGYPAPDEVPSDRFWGLLAEFFSSLGWGTLHLELPRAGVASLTSEDWAEADPSAGALQPMCHLTTGILADVLGRLAGTDLAVMEVECRSRGDRQCRFLLGSREALGLLHQGLHDGAPYRDALEALG